jgi:hypothetical protein
MTRAHAAKGLLQLLSLDLVGDALDTIGSDELRRRLRQVQTELRGVLDDESFERALALAGETRS